MDSLAMTFSSGWASGINAYLVVLVLGITDRIGDVAGLPDVLGTWPVLIAASAMFALEFVADKIPYIDSAWDTVSTAIRPAIGAIIGVLLAGEASSLNEAVHGVVGGSSAFLSHLQKAGSRLAINSSPEPLTNVTASLTEDVAVFGVVALAIDHPKLAALIAGILLIVGLVALFVLARWIRRGWRRWKGKDKPSTTTV